MNALVSLKKSISFLLVALIGTAILASASKALDLEEFSHLNTLRDSALYAEADIFAPKTWKKAEKEYIKAKKSINGGKRQKDIDKAVSKAREYVDNAIRTTEVTKLTLAEYLEPRNKAKTAKASILVPKIYVKAEKQFTKATEKVESGNVKSALKEAAKSTTLFGIAEMEAIRVDILGKADRLIKKAAADDGSKYAVSTLDKAMTARLKANAILTNDRYNRIEAVEEAQRAEYEARHASNIARSVRSLNRNDQAWEKLMLLYEIQMSRVGSSLEIEYLPYDSGPLAAADAMISKINSLRAANENLAKDSEFLSSAVVDKLKEILATIGETAVENDPIAMGITVETAIAGLMQENAAQADELEQTRQTLASLEATYSVIEADLAVRVEQEERFIKAKTILNPSEGEVMFNSSNDVVLRLCGLSFDINRSTLKDEHMPLLAKVEEIIRMFPNAFLMIEGHTDASGNGAANVLLSEKRAFAVMQYIRQSMLLTADKIQSMGYGMDKPIASNQTEEGRSKNRRIDIIIMR